jgi:predicted RNase H-like HicB family nuclease
MKLTKKHRAWWHKQVEACAKETCEAVLPGAPLTAREWAEIGSLLFIWDSGEADVDFEAIKEAINAVYAKRDKEHPVAIFSAVFTDGDDGFIVAECPELPGCMSQGRTREEAERNIREAIESVLTVKSLQPVADATT